MLRQFRALRITIPGCEILKQGIQDQLKAGLSSLQMKLGSTAMCCISSDAQGFAGIFWDSRSYQNVFKLPGL